MTKVLVVDDEKDIRDLLIDELVDSGYQVIEAENGAEALDQVHSDRPDVLLLDLMMPVMNGIQVLKILKSDPDTVDLPVVLLTAVSAEDGEQRSKNLGADYYLTKPWEPDAIQNVIRLALRETAKAAFRKARDSGADDSAGEEEGKTQASAFIDTKDPQLNIKLGGGVPLEGLTLIEGATSTGKSVLCQQFAHTALLHGYGVAYFSNQHNAAGLVSQMASLGMDVSQFHRNGQLTVTAIPNVDPSTDCTEALLDLTRQVGKEAAHSRFVFIDVITSVTSCSQESAIISCFVQCKELGNSRNAIFIAAHPAGMSGDILNRLRSLSDCYFALRIEKSGTRVNNVLEVLKVGNAEYTTGNRVYFEIEPGMGVRVDPTSRIKV